MKHVAYTIEDLLEILAGLQGQAKMQIDSSDATIMHSIARQVFKGTALTDRQHALMQEKLQKYKSQFTALEYDFDLAVDSLRKPLRHIDRSQYISIVDHLDMVGPNKVYESYKKDTKWIKVRFPFSKKNIVGVEKCASGLGKMYHHEKGSHEHYFQFHELTAYRLVEEFQNRNFEIQKEILEYAEKVREIINAPEDYRPGIYDYELRNVHKNLANYFEEKFGKPSKHNLVIYKDRARLFGLEYFDLNELDLRLNEVSVMTRSVAVRESHSVLIDPDNWSLDQIGFTLHELDRFPLLVILDEDKALDQLSTVYQHFRNFIETHSVLFRMESHKDPEFNKYIKDNNLNYPLDKQPEIVYISKNKLPKPLLKSDWKPSATLLMTSTRMYTKTNDWLNECDLMIHYDKDHSNFMRFEHARMTKI